MRALPTPSASRSSPTVMPGRSAIRRSASRSRWACVRGVEAVGPSGACAARMVRQPDSSTPDDESPAQRGSREGIAARDPRVARCARSTRATLDGLHSPPRTAADARLVQLAPRSRAAPLPCFRARRMRRSTPSGISGGAAEADAGGLALRERGLGALRDQPPLKLREHGHDARHGLALGRGQSAGESSATNAQPSRCARCMRGRSRAANARGDPSWPRPSAASPALEAVERVRQARPPHRPRGVACVLDELDLPAAPLGLRQDRRALRLDPAPLSACSAVLTRR